LKYLFAFFILNLVGATSGEATSKINGSTKVISEADRDVTSGRAVQIEVFQSYIYTSIDAGRIAKPPAGGWLDGMILNSITDNSRETINAALKDKAENIVLPLRLSLKDFNVDELALSTTKNALEKMAWFQAEPIIFSKKSSQQARTEYFQSNTKTQTAFISYTYELSPDFSYISITAEISLARDSLHANKKLGRLYNIFYNQSVTSIIQLQKPSYEHHENVARWSANGGTVAKASITAAFAKFETLIPFALNLNLNDLKKFDSKKSEKAYAAGYYGTLVERGINNSNELTIWSKNLLSFQQASQ
jgi:hypothetical protein